MIVAPCTIGNLLGRINCAFPEGRTGALRNEMPETSAAACLGYQVESALAFSYLRDGVGERLAVGITDAEPSPDPGRPLVEWLPRPGGGVSGR